MRKRKRKERERRKKRTRKEDLDDKKLSLFPLLSFFNSDPNITPI